MPCLFRKNDSAFWRESSKSLEMPKVRLGVHFSAARRRDPRAHLQLVLLVHYQSELNPQIVREMKRATYANQLRHLRLGTSAAGQQRLLDCGAATGYLADLAKEMGWDAFAVEYSEFGANACEKLLGPGRDYRGQPRGPILGHHHV